MTKALIPYDNHQVPFVAQLSNPSTSFFDVVSGLDLFGDNMDVCHNITPLTRSWLMEGALMVVEGLEPEELEALMRKALPEPEGAPSEPEPAPEAPALEVSIQESAPETREAEEAEATEEVEDPATEVAQEAASEEPSLDDLLGATPEAPATTKQKRPR